MTWKICLLKDIVLFSLHFYVLVSISFSLKDVTGNADEECRELAFPDFFFFANKRLVKHNIRTVDVRNLDACEMLCYREPNCVSINFEREATAEGKFRCDLNNATHRGHDDEFVDTEGYFYRGAQSACDIVQCKNGGTCQSGFTEKGYRCLCSSGFNGENCETDIDECTAGTYNCSEDATCSNTKGGYNCSCNAGYTGDGHICTAFDICVAQNPCQNGAECINNGNGTHACKCEVGYSGNNCEHKFLTTSQILLTQASFSDHLQQYLAPVGLSWTLCYSTTVYVYSQYASDFHKHCDGKPNTVTIIKKAGYIFGGFTDIPWDSSGTYGHTSNAFIFSLRNNEGLAPFQANVTVPSQAIFKASYYGPTFGGGHDIRVLNDENKLSETQFGHSYSIPTGVQNQSTILAGNVTFIPDEVEVFYLAPS